MSEIKRAYRSLIRDAHPDAGGDTARAAMINAALDQAMQDATLYQCYQASGD